MQLTEDAESLVFGAMPASDVVDSLNDLVSSLASFAILLRSGA